MTDDSVSSGGSIVTVTGLDRHLARILAMQAACQLDVHGASFLDDLPGFLLDHQAATHTRQYAEKLARDTWCWKQKIDQHIQAAAEHWRIERLGMVDRATLRVAVAEMLEAQVPPKVILDEAIELAREFGGKDSPTFVNGILDRIWRMFKEEEHVG